MSKIKIFSLGGLNENGKNMYVVEVDQDIFVFDAGLKYDNDQNLGIDYIIPNFDYIVKNKNRVKGIFLTHLTSLSISLLYSLSSFGNSTL